MDHPVGRGRRDSTQSVFQFSDDGLARDLSTSLSHSPPSLEPVPPTANDGELTIGLQALDAVVWKLNPRTGQTEVTESTRQLFSKVLGLEPTCLDEGRYGFATHAHPDDRDRLLALLAAGIEKPIRTHFRTLSPDGEVRWIHLKVVKSTDDEALWFFAENQTAEREEEEEQKKLLSDRILSSLIGSPLDQIEPTVFSSDSLIESATYKWQEIFEKKHIRWIGPDAAPTGNKTEIGGSTALLGVLLDALFENALDALTTNPGLHSWVRFELFEDRDSLFLAVSDSGPGIAIADRASIFNPFFSTHPERSSGLGLTLARSAAEWHGGNLKLDHFSKGTRLVAEIPKRFRLQDLD